MRGHEQVIALRNRGVVPEAVGINSTTLPTYGIDPQGFPWVDIRPTENVHRLDLRFLVGIRADVWADNPERRAELAQACYAAGASEVYANGPVPS